MYYNYNGGNIELTAFFLVLFWTLTIIAVQYN